MRDPVMKRELERTVKVLGFGRVVFDPFIKRYRIIL